VRNVFVVFAFILTSCYSSTVYTPHASYTEAEVNLVFDKEGFRGVNGWVWQLGTLVYECDKNFKCTFYGWPEEEDMLEEWDWILNNQPPRRNTPNN